LLIVISFGNGTAEYLLYVGQKEWHKGTDPIAGSKTAIICLPQPVKLIYSIFSCLTLFVCKLFIYIKVNKVNKACGETFEAAGMIK
jgi:hypothetical protein